MREGFASGTSLGEGEAPACGAGSERRGLPDAEKVPSRCALEPGPPQLCPLPPRPRHDVSLSETGSGQGARERARKARITAGWTLQSLEQEGFALWLVCGVWKSVVSLHEPCCVRLSSLGICPAHNGCSVDV